MRLVRDSEVRCQLFRRGSFGLYEHLSQRLRLRPDNRPQSKKTNNISVLLWAPEDVELSDHRKRGWADWIPAPLSKWYGKLVDLIFV